MTSNRYGPVTKPKTSDQLNSGGNRSPGPTWSTISANIWLPFISNGLGYSEGARAPSHLFTQFSSIQGVLED